jgi:hypothetical protein
MQSQGACAEFAWHRSDEVLMAEEIRDKLAERIEAKRAAAALAGRFPPGASGLVALDPGIKVPSEPFCLSQQISPVMEKKSIGTGENLVKPARRVLVRRPPTLSDLQQRILERLADVRFSTNAQLASWCKVQAPAITKAVQWLIYLGLIEGSLTTRPMILHLSYGGGQFLNKPQPYDRRYASWSVMAHACHANAVQEMLLKEYPGFRFLSRDQLLRQGFNPGHGEHGAIDDSGVAWFVLLDDFMMGSDRIARAWMRRHAPNRKYWPDHTGRAWRDVVQRFLVVCTDDHHAERHRKWILKNHLPAEVRQLTPLWKT